MITHSSIPAGKTPWMEEPGGLQSMGSQSQTRLRVGAHTWVFCLLEYLPQKCAPHSVTASYCYKSKEEILLALTCLCPHVPAPAVNIRR